MHYFESFHHGGLLMWALLACSILGLAVIIDRAWAFWKNSLDYETFFNQLKLHLSSPQKMLTPSFLQRNNAPIVQITKSYYELLKSPTTKRNTKLSRIVNDLIQELHNRMELLKTIAQIAPLLGLLATVTGLITSLHHVELLGNVALPSDIAGAVWKSLTPLATGLMISIPCLVVYSILSSKIGTIATQLSETITELDSTLAPLIETQTNEETNSNLEEYSKA